MKILTLALVLSLAFLSGFSQQNLRGNRVSADTIKHSTVTTIPTWPATGLKEFYHQDTLKAIDSLGEIHYLTKFDKTFRYEIISDNENNIPTTIKLYKNCKVFYNGTLIPGTSWTGINTYRITLLLQTRQYDFLTINTGSK
jgi:hypothetical protein